MIPEKDYPIVRTIYDKVTPLFLENFLTTDSEVVNQGGTSSGKTYQILKVLAQRAIDYDGSITTVTGQDIPNLKDGSYSDFKSIIDETPSYDTPYLNTTNQNVSLRLKMVHEYSLRRMIMHRTLRTAKGIFYS